MDWKRWKESPLLPIAGAGVFVAFLLVIKVTTPSPPPVASVAEERVATQPSGGVVITPPVQVAPPRTDDAQSHLFAAQTSLENATRLLAKATTNNKGGYLEKAIAAMELSNQDMAKAAAYVEARAGAVWGEQPLVPLPGLPQLVGRTNAPNVVAALDAIKAAMAEVSSIGDGLGGNRDKLLVDLNVAALNSIEAINFTGATPRPAPMNPGLQATATPERFKPLRFVPSPVGGVDLVLTSAKRLMATRMPEVNTMTAADVLPPVRTFLLNAQEVANDKGLESSRDMGFSYFMESGGRALARGAVTVTPDGAARSSGMSYGGTVIQPVVTGLNDVAKLEQVQKGSYEPRLVNANPPMRLTAIWLVSDNGGPDLIYPVVSPSPEAPAMKVYVLDDYLKVIRPVIKEGLKRAANAPPGAGG